MEMSTPPPRILLMLYTQMTLTTMSVPQKGRPRILPFCDSLTLVDLLVPELLRQSLAGVRDGFFHVRVC